MRNCHVRLREDVEPAEAVEGESGSPDVIETWSGEEADHREVDDAIMASASEHDHESLPKGTEQGARARSGKKPKEKQMQKQGKAKVTQACARQSKAIQGWRAVRECAGTEGHCLLSKISNNSDPSRANHKEIKAAMEQTLHECGPDPDQEAVYSTLTEKSYDTEKLIGYYGLEDFDAEGASLHDFLENFFYEAFKELVYNSRSPDDVVGKMKAISLEICADKWTARACKRVSQCYGLPKDGHVVHSLVSGRTGFFARGPEAEAKVKVVQNSETKWDMAAHRLGVWLVAHSSLGKDNALAILKILEKKLQERFPGLPIFNNLEIGRLTYAGLLEAMKKGKSAQGDTHWLSWKNSEIKQCLGKRENDIQESDFCQLCEGVPIGKRIKDEMVSLVGNFWFAIGAHPRALHDFFGSAENGRLRGFVAYLDKSDVMAVSLAAKVSEQLPSMTALENAIAFVIDAQQRHSAVVQSVHTPEALTVFHALHEAARKLSMEIDDRDSVGMGRILAAMWPAIVKFVGKGHSSICNANLWARNGVWNSWRPEGPVYDHTSWLDEKIRFEDALAAGAKLLLHLHGQMLSEILVEIHRSGESDFLPEQPYVPNFVIHKDDQDNELECARAILLASLARAPLTLFKDGLRLRYTNSKRPDLRSLCGAVKTTDQKAWQIGVQKLIDLKIIRPTTTNGNFTAQDSSAPKEALDMVLKHIEEVTWACQSWRDEFDQHGGCADGTK